MADHHNKSSAELEREVEMQRSRVSDTIDQIQGQLSPGQLVDQFMAMTKGGAGDFAQNLGRSITANPLPVALMGASLIWLMSGRGPSPHRDPEGYRHGDSDAWRSQAYRGNGSGQKSPLESAKSFAAGVGDRISGAVEGVSQAADDAGHRYGERFGRAGEGLNRSLHDARDGAMQAGGRAMRMLEEQPLVAGALLFAIGAAIGAVTPRSREEDALMGEAADSVKHAVQDAAEPLLEEGKRALEEGREQLEEGRDKLQHGLDDLKDRASSSFGNEAAPPGPGAH